MALALATILAAVAAAKAAGVSLLSGLDPSVLDLMAFLALAIALVRIRALPTLTRLAEERGRPRSGESASRPNAVLLPALIAFALLLVVFLLFVIFGVGAVDTLSGVGHNPFVLGIIGFLLLSITASLALAMTLARTKQRRQQLYIVLPDAARQRRNMFLGASIIGSSLFGLLAAAAWLGVFPHGYAIHFLSFGLMFGLGPYGLYAAAEQRRIRRLEERFPDYLRDLAASHMGGLTLSQSAITAAKGEYGELTPEIRKVADQLSWNVSFSEALARLAERVHTPLVQRAVNLILQADRSGGSTTDVLLAAARDAREIKTLETERRIAMSLYTIVVYVTFFVFLGVVAILYSQFAPQIIGAGHDAAAAQSSDANADLGGFGLGDSGLSLGDYQLFYYLAALVQGIGDGIVAGLLGNGKAVLGLRHAFLMVLFSYFTFLVLLR
jgi:flagellar protein FlaJ